MQERSNAEFVQKHGANALMVSFEMGYIPVCPVFKWRNGVDYYIQYGHSYAIY